MSAHSLSRVWLFVAPWTVAGRAPLPMEFSRQEYIIPYVSVVFPFPLLFFKKHHWFADRLKLKDWFQKIRTLDGGSELPWSHWRCGLQHPPWKTLVEPLPKETNLRRHWEQSTESIESVHSKWCTCGCLKTWSQIFLTHLFLRGVCWFLPFRVQTALSYSF